MADGVSKLEFAPGYIYVTDSYGRRKSYNVAGMLRALDIPTGLTYSQVSAITTLANLVVVLIRTLIARDVLDENFLEKGEYDLQFILQSIEDMGGSYGEPDLNVT